MRFPKRSGLYAVSDTPDRVDRELVVVSELVRCGEP